MIENYQKYYYALFNQITDLISELETKNFTQEMMIDSLKKLQIDAEERFLKRADRQTTEYENSIYQQYLILNNGLMSIFVEDSEKYQKTPESAELLSELKSRKAIHIEYDRFDGESFIFGKYDGKIW
jgi:hypothetical protein